MFSNQRKSKKGIHFEIIPMIDVMMILVLFLAVMAFLPQVQNAIQTDLPPSSSQDQVTVDDIMVTRARDGLYVQGNAVNNEADFVNQVRAAQQGQSNRRVVIAAEASLPYEEVVQLLTTLQKAGIRNVALATESENQ